MNALMTAHAGMPPSMFAGDALKVSFAALADSYPVAGGYSVALVVVQAIGGVPVKIDGVGSASDWLCTVPGALSADWAVGRWRWAVRVAHGGDEVTISTGEIEVRPNPMASNVDTRSHARRVLDALDATIEGRASKSDLKVTFADGRSIERLIPFELVLLRGLFAAFVACEERFARGLGPGRVLVSL